MIIIEEERKFKLILDSAHEPMMSFVRRARYPSEFIWTWCSLRWCNYFFAALQIIFSLACVSSETRKLSPTLNYRQLQTNVLIKLFVFIFLESSQNLEQPAARSSVCRLTACLQSCCFTGHTALEGSISP